MSFVNRQRKEIHCKIIYYGPGMGGKTTNIQYVYQKTSPQQKGDLASLSVHNERTLFFDFLPLELGQIRGYRTRFHLYTVPGQMFFEASKKHILRGVDGIVFVADSQLDRLEENIDSLKALEKNLEDVGYELQKIPVVIQYNKRDLPNVAPLSELAQHLNKYDWQEYEAVASEGSGVFESLKMISKLVLTRLRGHA